MRNTSVKLFEFGMTFQEMFKDFSIFSSGSHFVKWSGTFWAIFVEGLMKNIYEK